MPSNAIYFYFSLQYLLIMPFHFPMWTFSAIFHIHTYVPFLLLHIFPNKRNCHYNPSFGIPPIDKIHFQLFLFGNTFVLFSTKCHSPFYNSIYFFVASSLARDALMILCRTSYCNNNISTALLEPNSYIIIRTERKKIMHVMK